MRLLPFISVSAMLAAVVVFSLLLSERGLILHDRPVVAHLGEIEQPADINLWRTLDDYGVHLVHPGRNIDRLLLGPNDERYSGDAAALGAATPPAVGRSIREIGFFGMPFGWFTDLGDVIYVRNRYETVYAQLNVRGLAAVNKANDRDVFAGNVFPFWVHAWGWLWVAGLGVAIWLWFRAQARRRAELGLI